MSKLTDDPVALIMQCCANPDRPPVPATAETVTILNREINRLRNETTKLETALGSITARMSAGQQ